jgi:hypothetical protein
MRSLQEGALTLYTTSMKVRQLVADGCYSVETLDPADTNDKGYQRLLNNARAKKLADCIVKGKASQDAFLPTSVPDSTTPTDLRITTNFQQLQNGLASVGALFNLDKDAICRAAHRQTGCRTRAAGLINLVTSGFLHPRKLSLNLRIEKASPQYA